MKPASNILTTAPLPAIPASAGANTSDCANVQVGKKALIVRSNVRATHIGCKRARALPGTYFTEVMRTAQEVGGGAQPRGKGNAGSYIDGCRCTTRDGETTLNGSCTTGTAKKRRSVRFDESGSGPA